MNYLNSIKALIFFALFRIAFRHFIKENEKATQFEEPLKLLPRSLTSLK